ncbi:MAG TPA: PTS fructose transporter subunit EIIBC, partial [Erwinia persicina]|nr:PTS fructose transporter subunit EIIBC [Erwinia persicina]
MKTLLIIDSSLGLATGYLAKNITTAAAASAGLTLTDNPAEADQVIVAGKNIPADSNLNGKAIYLADIEQLLRQPAEVLAKAQTEAR